jgi:hypothetical protein
LPEDGGSKRSQKSTRAVVPTSNRTDKEDQELEKSAGQYKLFEKPSKQYNENE